MPRASEGALAGLPTRLWAHPRLADERLRWGLVLVLALAFPLVVQNRYYVDVAALTGLYVMLGLGLNIVVGYAGLLDLGYVAFYAIGAYTTAILLTLFDWSFWAAVPVSAAVATASGVLLGLPVLRLRGDYLAMVTLGFGEIVRIVLNNLEVTGGPNGIISIPRPRLGDFVIKDPAHFYYLILAFCVLTVFAVARLRDSRLGRAWTYIREDELAAEMSGISLLRMKILAFALGATWSGFAGSIFAVKMRLVAPESFTWVESFIILCIVVVGGMGSIAGVTVGAVAMIVLPELLRGLSLYRMLVFGGVLVLMMLFRPEGLLPGTGRRRAVRPAPADAEGRPA
ncbi:MAG: ABC transporter permease subunit [Candidatus Rokuibacteriota bacterium]